MANASLDLKKAKQVADDAMNAAGDAQKHSDLNRTLIMAVLTVTVFGFAALFVSVGAMLQNYLAEKTNAYQSLVDKITEQNVKIDLLYDEMRGIRQVEPSVSTSSTKN